MINDFYFYQEKERNNNTVIEEQECTKANIKMKLLQVNAELSEEDKLPIFDGYIHLVQILSRYVCK
jgi:hypothetical protein